MQVYSLRIYMSLVLNLPHDARHDVEPLGLGLNPNDGALAEDLAHDDLVDVLDTKSERA